MPNSSLWIGGNVSAPLPRAPGEHGPSPAQPFEIDVRRRSDQPVVARVTGSIDLLTAPALRLCLDDNVTDPHGLVLDFSRVDFLAASGLTVLADIDRRAGREKLRWGLVANSRPVIRPLELLGLRQRLPTYETVPRAIAAVTGVVTR